MLMYVFLRLFVLLLCTSEISIFSMNTYQEVSSIFSFEEREPLEKIVIPKVDQAQTLMDFFGKSTFAFLVTQKRATKYPISEERVSPELEDLWKKAQEKIGILPCFQIPIRYEEKKESTDLFAVDYGCLSSTIKNINELPYSVLKFSLNHEAQHVLNNDVIMRESFPTGAFLGSLFALTAPALYIGKKTDSYKKLFGVGLVGGSLILGASGFVAKYFEMKVMQDLDERRADFNATKITQCETCLGDMADYTKGIKENTQRKIAEIDMFLPFYKRLNKIDIPLNEGQKTSLESLLQKKKPLEKILEKYAGNNLSSYFSEDEFDHFSQEHKRRRCDYHEEEEEEKKKEDKFALVRFTKQRY